MSNVTVNRMRAATAGLQIAAVLALALTPAPAAAGIFGGGGSKATAASPSRIDEIQRALKEQRQVDAGRLLDTAALSGDKDPMLAVLSGELALARGRVQDALRAFRSVSTAPAVRARALEGEGVALARLDRRDEALAVLRQAVTENPSAWRAWNALGSSYDGRREWAAANEAYEHALAGSPGSASVLNNRGYSRLLQGRYDEAVADLAEALQMRPGFAEARNNLRLALAMKGDYVRATNPGGMDDRATLLNNAGLAAGFKGDFAQAESLLQQAIDSRGEYYGRASENLKTVRGLAAAQSQVAHAAP